MILFEEKRHDNFQGRTKNKTKAESILFQTRFLFKHLALFLRIKKIVPAQEEIEMEDISDSEEVDMDL